MSLSTTSSTAGGTPAPLSDLYQEVIMEHSRRPRFKGRPTASCQFCQEGKNPLCGDQITLYCRVEEALSGAEPLVSLGFEGHGCSISQASASMLCDAVQHLAVSKARAVLHHAEAIYTGREQPDADDDLNEDVDALFGVSKFPVRVKCAALAWKTFELILDDRFQDDGSLKAACEATAQPDRVSEPADAASRLPVRPLGAVRGERVPVARRLRVVSTED